VRVEKVKYPKEEIEHVVDQIIKLHNTVSGKNDSYGAGYYNQNIEDSMKILNEGLKMLVTPKLYLKADLKDLKIDKY
jgi:uncharacterized protein (DUF2164 family)